MDNGDIHTPEDSTVGKSIQPWEVENPEELLLSDGENRDIPEGTGYPLNSKRLKASHIQRIAKNLLLPMGGTTVVTRQLAGGRQTYRDG